MEAMLLRPAYKDYLWGGTRLKSDYGKKTDMMPLAESWECSVHPDGPSVVASGQFKGQTLTEVLDAHPEFIGSKAKDTGFPVLVKFIDAAQDLSVQVHPGDEYAGENEQQRGKTEMWYVLESDKGAHLYNGLKKQITPEEYKHMVEDDTICEALARYEVSEGDVFFIPAGRIHSIGKGCFVAEIQQTSDVTYRIYAFKRKDKDGHYRELHTKEAALSIDYQVMPDYRTHYVTKKNEGVQVVSCPYFTTAVYDLDEPMTLDYSELDSFVVLIGVKGAATLVDDEGNATSLRAGETVLVPATTKEIRVEGKIKLLETYV